MNCFADGMIGGDVTAEMPALEFSDRAVETALVNKIVKKNQPAKHGRSVNELMERLILLQY